MKIKAHKISMAILYILIVLVFATIVVKAEDEVISNMENTTENVEGIIQDILNEKSGVAVNLNSQIVEDGKAKKQGIHNIGSWCNVNINRNTYKFFYIDNTEK